MLFICFSELSENAFEKIANSLRPHIYCKIHTMTGYLHAFYTRPRSDHWSWTFLYASALLVIHNNRCYWSLDLKQQQEEIILRVINPDALAESFANYSLSHNS